MLKLRQNYLHRLKLALAGNYDNAQWPLQLFHLIFWSWTPTVCKHPSCSLELVFLPSFPHQETLLSAPRPVSFNKLLNRFHYIHAISVASSCFIIISISYSAFQFREWPTCLVLCNNICVLVGCFIKISPFLWEELLLPIQHLSIHNFFFMSPVVFSQDLKDTIYHYLCLVQF